MTKTLEGVQVGINWFVMKIKLGKLGNLTENLRFYKNLRH